MTENKEHHEQNGDDTTVKQLARVIHVDTLPEGEEFRIARGVVEDIFRAIAHKEWYVDGPRDDDQLSVSESLYCPSKDITIEVDAILIYKGGDGDYYEDMLMEGIYGLGELLELSRDPRFNYSVELQARFLRGRQVPDFEGFSGFASFGDTYEYSDEAGHFKAIFPRIGGEGNSAAPIFTATLAGSTEHPHDQFNIGTLTTLRSYLKDIHPLNPEYDDEDDEAIDSDEAGDKDERLALGDRALSDHPHLDE